MTGTVHSVQKTTLRACLVVLATGAVAAGTLMGVAARKPSAPALQVSAGSYHTCVSLGETAILCWGLDDSGQLGGGRRGSTGERKLVLGATGVKHVEVGGEHSCFIQVDGGLLCWGHNGEGQIGDGTIQQRWSPVPVSGLPGPTQTVSVGRYHTCALDTFSIVRCWGRNSHGQVGDGTRRDTSLPRVVEGLPAARALAAGERHTCALLLTGTVSCWGDNSSGQLGTAAPGNRLGPVRVEGVRDAVAVVAGDRHTCVVTEDRSALCWGRNSFQELGSGPGPDPSSPVRVAGVSDILELTAGEHHTCALLEDHTATCWGRNSAGQLGNGAVDDAARETGSGPTRVALSEVTGLDAGGTHTCAVVANADTYCWGYNRSSQLGDLATATRPWPLPVELVPAGRS